MYGPADVHDEVCHLLSQVAAEVVLPRFRSLADADVRSKPNGELVTVADVEAEERLAEGLRRLLPGAAVVGEEAVADDPSVLDRAREAHTAWVIDPIDGTAHFTRGEDEWALMVALVEGGLTVGSWILQPTIDRLWHARRHGGAFVDGRPLRREPAGADLSDLVVTLTTRLMDADRSNGVRDRTEPVIGRFDRSHPPSSIQYGRVAGGALDAVLYWRTRVWDQAAGCLLLEEAGGRAARLDGADYEPWSDRTGLLLAADAATHRRLREVIAPGGEL